MADRFASRRDKLLRKVKKCGVEALLVTNEKNVRYLTGFTGDSSFLLIGPKRLLIVSDGRYTTQLAEECPSIPGHIRKLDETTIDAVGKVVKKLKLKSVGFESDGVTHATFEALCEAGKSAEWVATSDLIIEMRQVKDAVELAEIRLAIDQAERAFTVLRASLLPDMTERQFAHDLEHTMRRFGADRAGFDPIVAVGANSALPHARPGEAPISASPILLIDWGAETPGGYKSDLTRVLATGKIPPKLEKIYRVVLNAQQAAIDAIRPGAIGKEVEAVARRVIDDAGFGKRFNHGLGHGIGLDIHEQPRLSKTSDTELAAGMVITVEPGIYLPGWGGVRIEDDVLVTRDGCEKLTSLPREFEHIRAI